MKATHPKISVVIPIYNVAPFLEQALDSIVNQTYENLEIICVNDGSTDDSLEIIKKFAEKDSRIKVIDKQNEGYGASCNRGLREATGDWISVIEPDDWIEPEMYERMLEFASHYEENLRAGDDSRTADNLRADGENSTPSQVDIIKTPYFEVQPDAEKLTRVNCDNRALIKPPHQPFTVYDVPQILQGHPSIWSAIYRKQFLDNNNIKFAEIPGAGWADNPFLIETMCQADAIVYLDEPFYNYRADSKEKERIFHQRNFDIPFKRWDEMMDILERLQITDARVLLAHYSRGFVYMAGVLEHNDLESNPEIQDFLSKMFSRMDANLVLNSEMFSPGAKKLFARVRNLPEPKTSKTRYISKLVKNTAKSFKNAGAKKTIKQVGIYLKTHNKRTGN